MQTPHERLYQQIGYTFRDPALLKLALTHRSAGYPNNERLEYLGDALLGFVIADLLFQRFTDVDEGQLTRARAALVNKGSLVVIAQSLKLGQYLTLGEGEMKSGGWRRDSILANALEALIGAIYLDGGILPCRELIEHLHKDSLACLSPNIASKDPKTRLQEYLQARHLPLPQYSTIKIIGEPHAQQFTVQCDVSGINELLVADGNSRRRAEQAVAVKALAMLSQDLLVGSE